MDQGRFDVDTITCIDDLLFTINIEFKLAGKMMAAITGVPPNPI